MASAEQVDVSMPDIAQDATQRGCRLSKGVACGLVWRFRGWDLAIWFGKARSATSQHSICAFPGVILDSLVLDCQPPKDTKPLGNCATNALRS